LTPNVMSKKKIENVQQQCRYTARTEYNADCINSFCRARFTLYQKKKQALLVLISIALIAVGAAGLIGNVGAVISIPLGCWLLTAIGSFPKSDADRMIAASEGNFPVSQYTFDETGFSIVSGGQTNRLGYESMIRLVEDESYFIFFATPKLAYMVLKAAVRPIDENGFRSYTARRCGLEWSELRPWYDFTSFFKKIRKK